MKLRLPFEDPKDVPDNTIKDGLRVPSAILAAPLSASGTAAASELRRGQRQIDEILHRYRNATESQLIGRVAEPAHAATFNANAALSGSDLRAYLTHPHSEADIVIADGGAILQRAQLKYERTPLRTAAASADGKYLGQQRVVPTEQVNEVRRSLSASQQTKFAVSHPQRAFERADAEMNTSATLQVNE